MRNIFSNLTLTSWLIILSLISIVIGAFAFMILDSSVSLTEFVNYIVNFKKIRGI